VDRLWNARSRRADDEFRVQSGRDGDAHDVGADLLQHRLVLRVDVLLAKVVVSRERRRALRNDVGARDQVALVESAVRVRVVVGHPGTFFRIASSNDCGRP
jgi:hypothetical protein